MTRSRKKTPIHGIASDSEKHCKQLWHRRFRHATRVAIIKDREVMPHFREHGDPWGMAKDGKIYYQDDKAMRK